MCEEVTPTPDLAAIVRGLTKAQREALLHRNAGGTSYRWCGLNTLEALHARKIVGKIAGVGSFFSPHTAIQWPLTPLGKQIRAHLQDPANAL
jgi:hypothetical protein